ncbi:MAG: hypothetical protein L3K24_13675 [Gammaproteobacteria bacterium]|nr:hypothetical protein [Gammaproteobacteria bacterium]
MAELRGGTGNDTLNGNDAANTWAINAANSGALVNNSGQAPGFAISTQATHWMDAVDIVDINLVTVSANSLTWV